MKLKEIQSIVKDFEVSNLTVLELETADVKLKLSKNKEQVVEVHAQQHTHNTQAPTTQNNTTPVTTQQTLPVELVKSPLVGTYYEASNPKNPPFVVAGQHVKKGDVLCIIEAMKIMNEITSPFDGIVEKVCFKNGEVIGFGAVLFEVKTDATK